MAAFIDWWRRFEIVSSFLLHFFLCECSQNHSHNVTKAKTYKNKLKDICTAVRVEDEKTGSPAIYERKNNFEIWKLPYSFVSLYSYIALLLLGRNSIPLYPYTKCRSRWWVYTFRPHSTNVAAKETVL